MKAIKEVTQVSIERITRALFRSIDELNDLLPADRRLEKSPQTVLFASGGNLSSLELVNLIVAAEQNIEDEFGLPIVLADEKAMSQKNSPFKTVAGFVSYISLCLEESGATAVSTAAGEMLHP